MDTTRNVTLAGHGNTGKTTLAEAMLYTAKVVTRMGTVRDGTTISDFTDIEKDRKNSLTASVMHLPWNKTFINLIDTPGYTDFLGEAISGIKAADTVLITVAGNAGIQVNTRGAWGHAVDAGKARAMVISKVDADNVNFQDLVDEIRETFGSECIPVTIPDESGGGLTKIIDLLAEESADHEDRESLVESIIEVDDALMEKYLEGETVEPAEIAKVFHRGMLAGSLVPIFAVASEKELGVKELMDYVAGSFPNPSEVKSFNRAPAEDGGEGEVIDPAPEGPFAAQVFKTVTDDYVGKLSYFRVVTGKAATDSNVVIASTGKKIRLQNMFQLQGKDQTPVTELTAGNVYAVSKIDDLAISDTLCTAQSQVILAPIVFPQPMVFVAVTPKSRQDEQRISGALAKLSAEDPTFRVTRNAETSETVATGMSQLHLDIKLKQMKSRFNVEVDTKIPRIPYRETVTSEASARYRHKKQTGGAGQFAEVWLRLEPLRAEDGTFEGFEFASEVFGGAISQAFIPSIEKGVKAVMKEGAIAGYPIDGVKAVVYDGKEHPVDSKDIAFQIAGREAFKLAMKDARPVLLEPIVDVEVLVPSSFMGEITGDLNTRRGRIQGMETEGQWQVISAKVPQAEIMSYSTDLRSMTQGEATYTMAFSHYDVVPSNIAQDVIARGAKKDVESDK